jgi:hypothetical protein
MLTIIEELPANGNRRDKRIRCLCHCGKETIVRKDLFMSGKTKSCGCGRGKRNDLMSQDRKIEKIFSRFKAEIMEALRNENSR